MKTYTDEETSIRCKAQSEKYILEGHEREWLIARLVDKYDVRLSLMTDEELISEGYDWGAF